MIFDTSIVLDMLKGKREFETGGISAITVMEIVRGIANAAKRKAALDNLINAFPIYWLNPDVIFTYAELYNRLKEKGKQMDDADLIIAATAMTNTEKLVTKDKGFRNLEGSINLSIES